MTTPIWDGEYADYLNAMVTYPYKIHTGRLVGVTKYISGPDGINTGTLVKYELESCFLKQGDKWVLLHCDGDESKTFVVSDEFAATVLEPAQRESECLQESQLDDDKSDNKGGFEEEEEVFESEGRVDVSPDQVKAVFAAAMNHARNRT